MALTISTPVTSSPDGSIHDGSLRDTGAPVEGAAGVLRVAPVTEKEKGGSANDGSRQQAQEDQLLLSGDDDARPAEAQHGLAQMVALLTDQVASISREIAEQREAASQEAREQAKAAERERATEAMANALANEEAPPAEVTNEATPEPAGTSEAAALNSTTAAEATAVPVAAPEAAGAEAVVAAGRPDYEPAYQPPETRPPDVQPTDVGAADRLSPRFRAPATAAGPSAADVLQQTEFAQEITRFEDPQHGAKDAARVLGLKSQPTASILSLIG